ncbi:MAG: LptA/OstA family protein [Hyphomicrobiaceae bacterium]
MRGDTSTRAGHRRLAPIDIAVSDRERERAFRRARRHTLLVKALRVVLPTIALGCLGFYGAVLTVNSGLKSRNITAGKVTVDPTNLTMADPRYSGFGKDGSEYKVHAQSAVTDLRMAGPVKLNLIDGEIKQPSGVVTRLKAKWGTYDQKKDLLELFEKIDIDATNGMTARLTRATVLAKESRIISREPVIAETTTGRIQARTMTLNTKSRKARFEEAVEVTLKPTQPTAELKGGDVTPRKRDAQAFGIDANSREPVVVTSRRLDVDDTAKTALFRENVVARQGEAMLAAPELDVTYAGQADPTGSQPEAGKTGETAATKLKTIHARGGVQMSNKGDRAESQTLDYDAESERIVLGGNVVMTQLPERRVTAETVVLQQKQDTALLTGDVVVTQGRNVLRGGRLLIDRKAGTAELTTPAAAGQAGGRISTLLYQNQAGKPASQKAKAREGESEPAGLLGANFKSDPNAPIEVEAASLDVNDRKHTAIYTGAVVAKQGSFVVRTDEMTAHYQGDTGLLGGAEKKPQEKKSGPGSSGTGSQLRRIEARRHVVVTGSEGQQATGEWADFDVAANKIVMGGNVVVSQGKQLVRAPEGMRLVIDLGSGMTRFEAEPGAIAKGGAQVSGAFATSVATNPKATGMPTCPAGAICKSGRLEAIFYPNQIKGKADEAASTTGSTSTKKRNKSGSSWRATTQSGGTP